MKEIENCPFCKGRLADFWREPPFSKCISCKLVIANPFPDPEDLDRLYETAWGDPSRNTRETGELERDGAHQRLSEMFRQPDVQNIERGLCILDFGAGRGALMRALEEKGGVEVYGIERYGSKDLVREGLKGYPDLEHIPKDVLFDGIFALDVIEHMRAPWKVFRNLRQRLKPGGWLCISMPNPNSLIARIKGTKWCESQKPGHIIFMGRATLIDMLKSVGYSHVRPLNWKVGKGDSICRYIGRNGLEYFGLRGSLRILAFRP